MKFQPSAVAAVALLATAPALAQSVHIDYDKTYDRSHIKTWAWASKSGQTLAETYPLMHERIVKGVEERLAQRGLQKVESNPDVFITYHTSSKEELSVNTTSFGYGYPSSWYWDPYWGGAYGGSTSTSVTTYTRGTLIVDVWDAKTQKLVWRASGTDTVVENPDKMAKRIDKMLSKMGDRWKKMVAEEKKAKEKAAKDAAKS